MPKQHPRLIFFDGRFVDYESARVHVLSTAMKYAAVVFEGVRAYWNAEAQQLYVFRLQEHLDRLQQSAKVVRMELPYALDDVHDRVIETIRRNELHQDLHIRIQLIVTDDDGLLDSESPVALAIATMPMGRFPEAPDGSSGLRVAISHWRRIADPSMPPRIKAISNYMNSRLALMQARQDGYDDTILLDALGHVTEGPGWNVFARVGGDMITPPPTSGILEGVTRNSLITLFHEFHGRTVLQRELDKTEVYLASEAFFCGSGKEIKSIHSVDGHVLGEGRVGDETRGIRNTYWDVAYGRVGDHSDWRTAVYG